MQLHLPPTQSDQCLKTLTGPTHLSRHRGCRVSNLLFSSKILETLLVTPLLDHLQRTVCLRGFTQVGLDHHKQHPAGFLVIPELQTENWFLYWFCWTLELEAPGLSSSLTRPQTFPTEVIVLRARLVWGRLDHIITPDGICSASNLSVSFDEDLPRGKAPPPGAALSVCLRHDAGTLVCISHRFTVLLPHPPLLVM